MTSISTFTFENTATEKWIYYSDNLWNDTGTAWICMIAWILQEIKKKKISFHKRKTKMRQENLL